MNWEAQLNLPPTENPSPYPSSLQSSFSKPMTMEKSESSWGTRDHRDGYLDPKILYTVENLLKNESSSGIHFDNYDKIPVEISESFPQINLFTDCDVNELLLNNVARMGYKRPTPVQKYAIPVSILRRDLMAIAQTGSGKTAAFLFPMFGKMLKDGPPPAIDSDIAYPIGLILAPTRELVQQLHEETMKFAHRTGIKTLCVFGGTGMQYQMNELKRGVDILVATPGRLIDFLDRKLINLSIIRYLILDEGDRMLDMGFAPSIKRILEATEGNDHETIMSSATFSPEMRKIAEAYMKDYVYLTVGKVGSTSENIVQKFYHVEDSYKMPLLLQVLQEIKGLTLIFVERRTDVDEVASFLLQNGHEVACIHGEKNQFERHRALNSFKSGRINILVATDIASRGLDIQNIENVINYDTPKQIEGYIHRIGRTGRIGKNGLAISFLNSGCRSIFRDLRSLLIEARQEIPEWYEDLANGMARSSYSSSDRRYGESSKFGGKSYGAKDQYGSNKENSEWGGSSRSYGKSDYDQKSSESGWDTQNNLKHAYEQNSSKYGLSNKDNKKPDQSSFESGNRFKCNQEFEKRNSDYFSPQNPPYNLINQRGTTRNYENPAEQWGNQDRKQAFQSHNQGDNQRHGSTPSSQTDQWGSQTSGSYQNSQRASQGSQNWGSNPSSAQNSQWKPQNSAQNSQRGDYSKNSQWGQENGQRGARDYDKTNQWGAQEKGDYSKSSQWSQDNIQRGARDYNKGSQWGQDNAKRGGQDYDKSNQWGQDNAQRGARDDKSSQWGQDNARRGARDYDRSNQWGGQENSQRGARNYDRTSQWGGQDSNQRGDSQRRDRNYDRSNQWGGQENSQRGARNYDKSNQWGDQEGGYERKFKNSSRSEVESQRENQNKNRQSLSDWGETPATKANANSGWGDIPASKAEPKVNSNSGWGETPAAKTNPNSGWGDMSASKAEPKVNSNSGWGETSATKANANSGWGDIPASNTEPKSNSNSGWGDAPASKTEAKTSPNSGWGDIILAKNVEKSNPNSGWGDTPTSKAEPKISSNSSGGDIPKIEAKSCPNSAWGDIPATKTETKCSQNSGWDDTPSNSKEIKSNLNSGWSDIPAKTEAKSSTNSSWGDIPPAKSNPNPNWGDNAATKVEAQSAPKGSWGDAPTSKAEIKSSPHQAWGDAPITKNEAKINSRGDNPTDKAETKINSGWSDIPASDPDSKSSPDSGWSDIPAVKTETKGNSNPGWGETSPCQSQKEIPSSMMDAHISSKNDSFTDFSRKIPATKRNSDIHEEWGKLVNPPEKQNCAQNCDKPAGIDFDSKSIERSPYKEESLIADMSKTVRQVSQQSSVSDWNEKENYSKNSAYNPNVASGWDNFITEKPQVEADFSAKVTKNASPDWGETLEEKHQNAQEKAWENCSEHFCDTQIPNQALIEETKEVDTEGTW